MHRPAAQVEPAAELLARLLACPRCRAALAVEPGACRCTGCAARFPIERGVPRLADDAVARDPRIAAEHEAQRHARDLYLEERSVANRWGEIVLPGMARRVAGAGGPVLDLGCSVGQLGVAWAAMGAPAPLVGLDLQGELLELAQAGYAARVEGDLHRLPFRDASVAAVVCTNTLHHVADPDRAAAEIARVLVPGGVLCACDPRHLAPIELAKRILRRHDDAFAEDHRAFRREDYRAILVRAGLEVEECGATFALGPLVAAGLDLVHFGVTGLARPVARGLCAADRLIARIVPTGRLGLIVLAVARRPRGPAA